ncbi:MAG: hypothetical protein VCA34_10625 [Roseibacillus sp.]
MKTYRLTLIASLALGLLAPTWAQEEEAPDAKSAVREIIIPKIVYPEAVTEGQRNAVAKHAIGSQKLSGEQDELSADVQELIDEQTSEKVIQLLEQVEEIMAEVTTSLDQPDTGGGTIAAETEIIEKIYEAAKQRSQQNGGT